MCLNFCKSLTFYISLTIYKLRCERDERRWAFDFWLSDWLTNWRLFNSYIHPFRTTTTTTFNHLNWNPFQLNVNVINGLKRNISCNCITAQNGLAPRLKDLKYFSKKFAWRYLFPTEILKKNKKFFFAYANIR